MATKSEFERGAEWRQWDFHIHTPASFQWSGKRFAEMTEAETVDVVDQMINTINQAMPAVFVLMDYWTFDGWFALKKRLSQAGSPVLTKLVLPGIELRLVSPTTYRLNAHVLFSDDVSDQDLNNFKSELKVALIEQPLSDECLKRLARQKLGDDLLAKQGIKAEEVRTDDSVALMAGSKCAEIIPETYKVAISKVPDGKAIAFMPWDTYNGLADADWAKHYAYVVGLMQSSPIFETRRQDQWEAFVGIETEENKKWFSSFQAALGNMPHLAVSGSDAHSFNDYAKFPSGKATWIKADPTFLGLLQAIKEPAKRSYIGERPDKLREIEENRTFFIDRISASKIGTSLSDKWLDGINVPLNADLVAIIGNKGSGKSALADVIALLGNSCQQKRHFNFLKTNRFRGKSGDPAKHFTAKITWLGGAWNEMNLNTDPEDGSVELIRYIPQGHFENLCNEHISGKSDGFQKELQTVIFEHARDDIRLGALDFDQLVERQEGSFRDQLVEYRKELTRINWDIGNLEAQSQPQVRRSLQELLDLKKKQIEEHNATIPPSLPKPSEQLSPEQQAAAIQLEAIAAKLKELDEKVVQHFTATSGIAAKRKAVQSIRDRTRLLERQYSQFQVESASDFQTLGLNQNDLVSLSFKLEPLNAAEAGWAGEEQALVVSRAKMADDREELLAQQVPLKTKLNEPQLIYQQNLKAIEQWTAKLQELMGAADAPETQNGLAARIAQLDELPSQLKSKRDRRLQLSGEIFEALNSQREAREKLFTPVQELIENNDLIREDYKLRFQANLGSSSEALATKLFELVKQNAGDFRGEDDSYGLVKRLSEKHAFGDKDGALGFVQELDEKIHEAAATNGRDVIGITSMLRKDKGRERTASEVYDLLFGLSYLEPRYSLLFQGAEIAQLSPGQRGALLLIFYLLVDQGRMPIVLDQPEENLDNETVYNLLVPVLTEAKKKRQIIMVTHNPNLAVVCDAEQVIYSSFDRKNGLKISYLSGSIENPALNARVVDVLEGTKPAFDNRRIKYH